MDRSGLAVLMAVVSALSGVNIVSSDQVCYTGLKHDINSTNPHRWVLPYKDPCEYATVLGGLTTHIASNQQGAPYYLDKIVIKLREFFGCQVDRKVPGNGCSDPEPLGLEDGSIPDESISASSKYNAGTGRLNGRAWYTSDKTDAWLEVDLGMSTVVSGVITQGYHSSDSRVTQYNVKYKKLASSDFDDVIDRDGTIQVFNGNLESAAIPVTNMFDQSIMATIVRIVPVAWAPGLIALRLELLQCPID